MEDSKIEARIQRLEDTEAIKDATFRYAFNINKGWNGKEINPKACHLSFLKMPPGKVTL